MIVLSYGSHSLALVATGNMHRRVRGREPRRLSRMICVFGEFQALGGNDTWFAELCFAPNDRIRLT